MTARVLSPLAPVREGRLKETPQRWFQPVFLGGFPSFPSCAAGARRMHKS